MDLTTTQLTIAELYTIVTTGGDTARFTSHDTDITYAGDLYQAIPIQRTQVSYHTDLQVDNLEISFGLVGLVVGAEEYSIPRLIQLGFLRNAHVYVYLVDYVALDSVKLIFEGWVTGNISYNRGVCTISVGSLLDKLNEKFPKYIYSDYCNHQLYGPYCGLSKVAWKTVSTAAAGTTTSLIYNTNFAFSAFSPTYYTKGQILMTSGLNAGASRTVYQQNDGHVVLLIPFAQTISVGDGFEAYPGCDKSGQTCDEKFSNYANFFGFEYTPKPEVLIG